MYHWHLRIFFFSFKQIHIWSWIWQDFAMLHLFQPQVVEVIEIFPALRSSGTSGSLTFLPGLIVTAYWSLPDSAIWLCFAVNTEPWHRGQNKFLWFAENRHCERWGKTGEYFSHDWSYLSIWSKLQSSAATRRGRLLNLSRLPKSKCFLFLIIHWNIRLFSIFCKISTTWTAGV